MTIPHYGRTAIYRLYDADERLLYVGITSNTAQRFARHGAIKPWWHSVSRRDVQWIATRYEALAAERSAIFSERPRWNVNRGEQGYRVIPDAPGAVKLSPHLAATAEMREGVPPNRLAKSLPWSTETLRALARQAGITRQRPPTVKSIKPRKRTAKRAES